MPEQSFPTKGHLYDLIIVGAGITGTECALASAQAGLDVLLVTTSLDTVYNLFGDGAKLEPHRNTFMASACHKLSGKKAFVGNWALHRAAKYALEHTRGIHFLQSSVSSLIVENDRVVGVDTWEGVARYGKKVALCVGSFLKARLAIGELTERAGRLSEMTYDDLFENLEHLEFKFETLELNAEFEDESLSYRVVCKVLAEPDENREGFKLLRLVNLYAAGLCASGYLSYEDAALAGQNLASEVVRDLA